MSIAKKLRPKVFPFDRAGIAERFFSCHNAMTMREIADKYCVARPTVSQWQSLKKPIPWEKLFELVHEQGLNWNWLLEGFEPKYRNPPNVESSK